MSFFFQLNSSCTLSCSLRLNFARSLIIFCLVQSVSTSEARSLASASSSSFIFTEGDLVNKQILLRQITVESIVKYRAICCSINQSVLVNQSVRQHFQPVRLLNSIFGKSHQRQLPYQFPPLSSTRVQEIILCFLRKGGCFLCFPKSPSKVHLASQGLFVRILPEVRPSTQPPPTEWQAGLRPFPLDLIISGFFCQIHYVCLCQGAFGWQPKTERS